MSVSPGTRLGAYQLVAPIGAGGMGEVVIEHNLDVIKTADHVIDIGPDGGDAGGRLVASGTPEEVAATPGSYTGSFLAPMLPRHAPRRTAR